VAKLIVDCLDVDPAARPTAAEAAVRLASMHQGCRRSSHKILSTAASKMLGETAAGDAHGSGGGGGVGGSSAGPSPASNSAPALGWAPQHAGDRCPDPEVVCQMLSTEHCHCPKAWRYKQNTESQYLAHPSASACALMLGSSAGKGGRRASTVCTHLLLGAQPAEGYCIQPFLQVVNCWNLMLTAVYSVACRG